MKAKTKNKSVNAWGIYNEDGILKSVQLNRTQARSIRNDGERIVKVVVRPTL